uniref:INO80 complex subunit B-like conserved region domain-containing protein n=1 Tax=Nicotiana tabacum TaxID=4097 RepID=A0A1S4ALW1_TOBAC|nr:PREDICTED: uncharacterized protein LOC107799098 [Nicotiana tabacum]
MNECGGTRYEGLASIVRKKRSQMLRRPRPESLTFPERRDQSPLTPVSDSVGRVSSGENTDDANVGGRIYKFNHGISRDSSANRFKGDYASKKNKEDAGSSVAYNNARKGDDTDHRNGASLRQVGNAENNGANDSKLKKVKLKVGGVTRTIQTKNNSYGASGSSSSTKSARPSDAFRPRQNLTPQDNSSEDGSPADKKSGSKGISWNDFSGGTFGTSKGDMGRNVLEKQGDKPHQNRKSKKMPKRLVLDGLDDDEDDEIRYLEKLKTSKVAGYKDLGEESTKTRSLSRVLKVDKYEILDDVGRSGKEVERISDRSSEYTDYEEDSPETPAETKREASLTTRQRALLSSRDTSATSANQIEFPNGLPPPPPRKQKEKLTAVEQQLKKAEAAERRRMQNEKAARELEAEAIRKILGQDSNRKKREEKIKKQQEELAQEKAAKEKMLASSTIRTVMGPTGTVVTFPQDMGLPSIFDSKPCSYPPPREKCAGPSCENPYKYRDSKSNLPLCSLKCYKAIHEKGC